MKNLEEFIRYIKKRSYSLDERYAGGTNHVLVTVDFIRDGKRESIIRLKSRKALSKLAQRVEMDNPERMEVIIHINDIEELHRYDFKQIKSEVSSSQDKAYNRPFAGFEGVTPDRIESIVNKRLEEERRDRMIMEQQTKLRELEQELHKKTSEIERLQNQLTEKDEEIESLEKTIESKKNFKYYAGLTGDILQSFGIKKEVIGKPLAGLLSGEENENTALVESTQDSSGIVDEDSEDSSPHQEMLKLLNQYLNNLDSGTLEKVFHIFSDIENDINNADRIIHFLQHNKNQS